MSRLTWGNERGVRIAAEHSEGRRALIIRRGPCVHDSRILREGETLAELGYAPLILGVVSEHVTERDAVIQGLPIMRLAPTSPFSWARSLLPRARPAQGPDGSVSGRGRGPVMRIAVRLHRWMRTLDFYRQAIGVVREQRPALIHCNDYNTMWVGVAARVVSRGSAVVYDSHELWADRNLRPEPRWWLLLCEFAVRPLRAPDDHRQPRLRRGDRPALPGPAAGRGPQHPRRPRRGGSRRGQPAGFLAERRSLPSLYVGALTTGRGLEVAIKALALLKRRSPADRRPGPGRLSRPS